MYFPQETFFLSRIRMIKKKHVYVFIAREIDADRWWLYLITRALSGLVVGQGASEPYADCINRKEVIVIGERNWYCSIRVHCLTVLWVTWHRAWRPGRYSGDGDAADGNKILRGWNGEKRFRSGSTWSPSGRWLEPRGRNIETVPLREGHEAAHYTTTSWSVMIF